MALNISAMASQAAAQGNAQLADYNNKAANYQGQYGNYQQQADAANKNVQDYTDYMKGAGSSGNVYHGEQDKQLNALGYDQNQMTAARGNLNQATGALSAYSDFANTAASKWGMNAGGFAAANAGALSGINNNIASNQNVVNGLSDIYKTAQTGANQFTGQVIQGEQNTLGGLQQVFSNASSQRDSAASMMNFYNDLAQKQGGMNAQQQQAYAQAQQSYAQASQALAQASLLAQQTNLARQQYDHQTALYAPPTSAMSPSVNTGMHIQGGSPAGVQIQGGSNPQRAYNPITISGNMQGSGARVQ